MNQERLARQMNEVVYAQRKLSYLKEKLEEIFAYDPVILEPKQRTLSVASVEAAAHYQDLVSETKWEIKQEESSLERLMESLLGALPEIIKNYIRRGMPLVAQWQKDSIESLALVFVGERFLVIPENKLTW